MTSIQKRRKISSLAVVTRLSQYQQQASIIFSLWIWFKEHTWKKLNYKQYRCSMLQNQMTTKKYIVIVSTKRFPQPKKHITALNDGPFLQPFFETSPLTGKHNKKNISCIREPRKNLHCIFNDWNMQLHYHKDVGLSQK